MNDELISHLAADSRLTEGQIEQVEEFLNDPEHGFAQLRGLAGCLLLRQLKTLERARLRAAFESFDLEEVVSVLDGLLSKAYDKARGAK